MGIFTIIKGIFTNEIKQPEMPTILNTETAPIFNTYVKKLTPSQKKALADKKAKKIRDRKELAKKHNILTLKIKRAAESLKKKLKVGRVVKIKGIKYVVIAKKRGKPIMTTLNKFQRSKRTKIKLSKQPIVTVDNFQHNGFDIFNTLLLSQILTIDTSSSYDAGSFEGGGGFSGAGASDSYSSSDGSSSSDSSSDSGGGDSGGGGDGGGGGD